MPPSLNGFSFIYKNIFFVKMADRGNDSAEEEDPTIAEDIVVTKYKMAGDMANRKYEKKLNVLRLFSSPEGKFSEMFQSCKMR